MQDLGREALLLAQQAQQQVLGANVLVREPLSLFSGIGQDALALVAQRKVNRGGDLFANRRVGLDLLADGIDRGVRPKKPVGQCLVLADQAQQQVFSLDVWAAKLAGLVAGEEDHPPGFFGVTFKHAVCLSYPQRDGCRLLPIIITASLKTPAGQFATAR